MTKDQLIAARDWVVAAADFLPSHMEHHYETIISALDAQISPQNLSELKRKIMTPYNLTIMQRFDDPEACVDWLIDHLAPRIVRDGMVVVPVEPTEAMLDAFYEPVSGSAMASFSDDDAFPDCYRAMISAAQKKEGE